MQNGNSEIETKSPPKSWKKFILAMLILAVFEICYLSIPSIPSRNMVIELIKIFYIVIFLPNLILGPLAFLWFGTLYSPANKKITCFTIATVLAVVAVYLFIKPSLAFDPEQHLFSYLFMGIIYAGIIGIFANGTYRRLTWVQRRSEVKDSPPVVTLGGGIAIFVLLILILLSVPNPTTSRRPAWMSRAKGTLRSTGSSQLAYQGMNNNKNYGSFQALKDIQYIADGYTLGNMIEKYSMTWSVSNSLTMSDESSYHIGNNAFTIVAYPIYTNPGYLMTFGITEDQEVRVYNPENSDQGLNEYNGLYDPRVWTWDPIL